MIVVHNEEENTAEYCMYIEQRSLEKKNLTDKYVQMPQEILDNDNNKVKEKSRSTTNSRTLYIFENI